MNRGEEKTESKAFAVIIEDIEDTLNLLARGWKEKRYFTQNMDVVFSSYLKIILPLFEAYSKRVLGGHPQMSFEKWEELCKALGLIQWDACDLTAYAVYHQSMLPKDDEMIYIRNMTMSFQEFLGAFSRMVDSVDLPLDEETVKQWYQTDLESSKWDLDQKVESMIPIILQHMSYLKSMGMLQRNESKKETVSSKGGLSRHTSLANN